MVTVEVFAMLNINEAYFVNTAGNKHLARKFYRHKGNEKRSVGDAHLPEPLLGVAIVPVVHRDHAEVEVDPLVQRVTLHQAQQPLVRQRPQLSVPGFLQVHSTKDCVRGLFQEQQNSYMKLQYCKT